MPHQQEDVHKDLIYRSIERKNMIGREANQDRQIIEISPFTGSVRLFGKTIPRKTAEQGIVFIRDKLRDILPNIEPYLDMFNHDLCPAAVAAYTALLYHQNRVDAPGNSGEGIVFIPS